MKTIITAIVLTLGLGSIAQNAPTLNLKSGIKQLEQNFDKFQSVNHKTWRLIQFYQTPTQKLKEALMAYGLLFHDYIPNGAYLVTIPANFQFPSDLSDKIYSISMVPSSVRYNVQIDNGLAENFYNSNGELQIALSFFKDVPVNMVHAFVSENGLRLLEFNSNLNRIIFNATSDKISSYLSYDEVKYIDALSFVLYPEDNLGRALHRSSSINQYDPLGPKFDGSGVSVAVNDDGFVGPHIDFTGRTEQSDVAGDFTGDHGDMVTGILGGAGNLNPIMEGMAKGAYLHIRQYSGSLPNTVSLHQNDSVMIFSSSYGNGCNAGYTTLSSQVDQEIRQNPSLIQVFSAGNSGTSDCGYGAGSGWGNITGGHKQGKNVIATANMERDEGLAGSSSRGPAMDGRIKPDITAHGNGQISTDPNNLYSAGGGTSAAAPGISGVLAQLYQAYRTFNSGDNPESPLLKASLLNSADDLGNVGPDFEYGWGRVNARRALEIIENNQYFVDSVTNFSSDNFTLNIPNGVSEARIMLYWLDYEASPASMVALVNDLDLEVNNGSVQLPWILDPTPNASNLSTPATNGADHLNNMEQVVLTNPSAGNVSIDVTGFDVPQGPQKYYVVYTFVYDEIEVIYPNSGEGFVPGEEERIFWDAYTTTGTFNLEYSIDDGSNWIAITSVPGTDRSYDWTVPNTVTGDALVRVSNGALSDVSDANFSIIETPQNIIITQVCSTSINISWDSVPGAHSYEVYLLGTRYMDSIGTTSATFFQVPANVNIENWISVSAFTPEDTIHPGRRAIAIYYDGSGVQNCAFAEDLSVTDILQPMMSAGCQYDNEAVEITISNYGQSSQSNFDVKYQVDGQAVVSETYTGTLNPGQSGTHIFATPFSLSTLGNYDLKIWVEAPSDLNALNDTAMMNIDFGGTAISTYPSVQDFESYFACGTASDCEDEVCALGQGWRNASNLNEDDIDWRVDNDGTPSNNTGPDADHTSGSTSGKYIYLEASSSCNFKEAQLYSPCIDLSNEVTAELSYWYHMFGGDMGELHLDVFDGNSWNLDIIPAVTGDQGNSWIQEIVDLDAYVGSVIQLRLRGITGDNYESDLALDDINIWASPVGVNEVNQNYMKIYPNPSNGMININYEFKEAPNSIKVLDPIGKVVYRENLNALSANLTIDLSEFAAGMYTVQIISDKGTTDKRIIKN